MKHLLEDIESVRTARRADAVACKEWLARVYTLLPSDTQAALQAAREIREYAREHDFLLFSAMAILVEGLCLYRMGNHEESQCTFAEAEAVWESIPEESETGPMLVTFGNFCLRFSVLQQALVYLRKGLEYCLAADHYERALEAMNFIGITHAKMGDYQQALTFFYRCLEYDYKWENEVFLTQVYTNISNTYCAFSNFVGALEYIEKALEMAHRNQVPAQIRSCLNSKGTIYGQMGEYANALECFLSCLDEGEGLDSDNAIYANLLNNIGNVYQKLGECDHSLEYHRKSLTLWHKIGDKIGEALSLHNIGCVYQQRGDHKEAYNCFLQSLTLREQIGDMQGIAHSLSGIADVYAHLGDMGAAKEKYLQSITLSEAMGDRGSKSHFFLELGQVCLHLYGADTALEYLHQGLSIAEELCATDLICAFHEALSRAYRSQGDSETALQEYILYHEMEKKLFNEESAQRIAHLQTTYLAEQAHKEAEIHRLKNVRLAAALISLKEVNRQLNELSEEKNELLSIAAHDLKNPLQSIKMIAEILKNEPLLEKEEIRDFSNDMLLSSDRMFGLITNLLDSNAIENEAYTLHPHLCDITSIVRQSVWSYQTNAEAKSLHIDEHYADGGLTAYADERATRQVLDNLISNAVKFSPIGSRISVHVRRGEEPASSICIEVQDEGPGFTEEDKKQLFRKFARLSAKPTAGEHSTGLGLSIVKKLVEAMKGKIRCESVPGKGATFLLDLPTV